MTKKILATIAAVIILVGGGAFYGGMKYAQSKTPQGFGRANFQDFQNLSAEERQQRLDELGAANIGGIRSGRGTGGGSASGEIIAKDDKSVTIKLPDGGSRIVFFSDSTEIGKSVNGTLSDLGVGETVTVNGEANQDGSITAKSIQIRPAMPVPTNR